MNINMFFKIGKYLLNRAIEQQVNTRVTRFVANKAQLELRSDLKSEFDEVRAEIKTEVVNLESNLNQVLEKNTKTVIQKMDTRFRLLLWLFIVQLVLVAGFIVFVLQRLGEQVSFFSLLFLPLFPLFILHT